MKSRPNTATAPTTRARSRSARPIPQRSPQGKNDNQESGASPQEPTHAEIAHEQILASPMPSENIRMDCADAEPAPGIQGQRENRGLPTEVGEPTSQQSRVGQETAAPPGPLTPWGPFFSIFLSPPFSPSFCPLSTGPLREGALRGHNRRESGILEVAPPRAPPLY